MTEVLWSKTDEALLLLLQPRFDVIVATAAILPEETKSLTRDIGGEVGGVTTARHWGLWDKAYAGTLMKFLPASDGTLGAAAATSTKALKVDL